MRECVTRCCASAMANAAEVGSRLPQLPLTLCLAPLSRLHIGRQSEPRRQRQLCVTNVVPGECAGGGGSFLALTTATPALISFGRLAQSRWTVAKASVLRFCVFHSRLSSHNFIRLPILYRPAKRGRARVGIIRRRWGPKQKSAATLHRSPLVCRTACVKSARLRDTVRSSRPQTKGLFKMKISRTSRPRRSGTRTPPTRPMRTRRSGTRRTPTRRRRTRPTPTRQRRTRRVGVGCDALRRDEGGRDGVGRVVLLRDEGGRDGATKADATE